MQQLVLQFSPWRSDTRDFDKLISLEEQLTSLFGQARWERVVSTANGYSTRPSEPHPLRYWTADPISRDEGHDLCLGCKVGNHVLTQEDFRTESETIDIGVVSGYHIVQVLNRVIAKAAPPDTPDFHYPPDYRLRIGYKMLLVQVGTDQYREIYHLEGQPGALGYARIVSVGGESILSTMDPDGGNGGFCTEGYWRFDQSGPSPLDFSAVDDAIRKVVPANTTFFARCYAIDLEHQQILSAGVQRVNAECRTCGFLGTVTVHFILNGSTVEPTTVQFVPSPN